MTHAFNGPLSGTTRVSQYQKGKTNLHFTEARDSQWQWHQLGCRLMQVCTSLQTGNHASTPPLSSYRPDALPAAQPTASKHWRHVQYNRSKIASTRCWATQKLTQSCNWRADHFQNLSTLLWSIACLIYSSLFTKLVATISISGNLLIIFWVILLPNKQTVILIIIGIPSPTHSFIPGLKPPFSANLSHCSFNFSSSTFTTWIPQIVYCYFWACLFSTFSFSVFTLFSCRFRAVD